LFDGSALRSQRRTIKWQRGLNGNLQPMPGKAVSMRTPWNTMDPDERRVRLGGILKFLFIVVLTALFFLLAHSMVEHRFFQGGALHPNGSVGQ
jgi:hypothetical protein